jgi:hypothetical protein
LHFKHLVNSLVLYRTDQVCLYRKLLAFKDTLLNPLKLKSFWNESVVSYLRKQSGLPLTRFEPTQPAILRLIVWTIIQPTTTTLITLLSLSSRDESNLTLKRTCHSTLPALEVFIILTLPLQESKVTSLGVWSGSILLAKKLAFSFGEHFSSYKYTRNSWQI